MEPENVNDSIDHLFDMDSFNQMMNDLIYPVPSFAEPPSKPPSADLADESGVSPLTISTTDGQ